ncbi:MAG: M28 family peptidase [Ignavibacteria bacterium]|nr:M28 family peptidase [Ignavibacteria bacterium]
MPHRIDSFGNVFVQVGQSPTVMFASHMDTYPLIDDVGPVDIRWSRGMLATDGTTNLGADDRAGMALMIDMINHNVPGLYAFFVGEELGRLGSINAAEQWGANRHSDTVRAVVAFDRRGQRNITHQRGIETCPTHSTKNCLRVERTWNELRSRPKRWLMRL